MKIRVSNRSSNFITPSFGYGCVAKCAYCYMRNHVPDGLTVANNTFDILKAVDKHALKLGFKTTPDQTHPTHWSYDISCNEDFAAHSKWHDWVSIFEFFKEHTLAMGTFATKFVVPRLLEFDSKRKMRIRFSLMPEQISKILEKKTSPIRLRLKAINSFIEAGYEVHLNFSPVVYTKESRELYKELFKQVNASIKDQYKPLVKAEVIFMTHGIKMHQFNMKENPEAEKLLWRLHVQDVKKNEYGGTRIRYKPWIKNLYIKDFKKLLYEDCPWLEIRYIF